MKFKRVLASITAIATAVSVFGSVAFADTPANGEAVTISVSTTLHDGNTIIVMPHDVEVSSDLSDTYEYPDEVATSEGVSAVDVLIAMHIEMFGSDFEVSPEDYLEIGESSWGGYSIKTSFGEATGNVGFAINGATPVDTSSEYTTYGYTAYSVTQTMVEDGDDFAYFFYADGWASDMYTWFEQDGDHVTELSMGCRGELKLDLMGLMIGWGGSLNKEDQIEQGYLNALADIEIWTMDEYGTTQYSVGQTDENGEICIDCGELELGRYYLTAVSEDEYIFSPILALNIVLPFDDGEDDAWYVPAIEYVYRNGLMLGYSSSDSFGVNKDLTRAEFATILYRAAGKPDSSVTTSKFSDVKAGKWYTDAINWAEENGIVKGYTGSKKGIFGVNDSITREQIAVMMKRFAEYNNNFYGEEADIDYFADADSISDYAVSAVKWCLYKDIITGKTDGDKQLVDAKATATRAECASMLKRYLEPRYE